ncbi:MAG: peptide chain release factor N(5)-glutamine methyltransferase [Candidatus Improbicoccus devescovinae]|nr:MAG: peptide chain release factor N(5)-glutamine methyltransferase [Candidatus Improbicoccus devescovinae]
MYEIYKNGKKYVSKNSNYIHFNEFLIIFEDVFKIKRLDLILLKYYNNYLYIHPKKEIIKDFFCKLKRVISGEPVQYITGHWKFYNINIQVGPGVFIPRDDTEILVRTCIKYLNNNSEIIDLCAGSGTIGLSLKKYFGFNFFVELVESYKPAFNFLLKNISQNFGDYNKKIKATNQNIFKLHKKTQNLKFDAIISNPPYIPSSELKFLSYQVKQEPKNALNGGVNGLYFYENITKKWRSKLKLGGFMAFEVGINQSELVANIMRKLNFNNIIIKKDINNIERVVLGFKNVEI